MAPCGVSQIRPADCQILSISTIYLTIFDYALLFKQLVLYIGHHLMKKGRLEKYVLLTSFYNIKEKGKVMPFV